MPMSISHISRIDLRFSRVYFVLVDSRGGARCDHGSLYAFFYGFSWLAGLCVEDTSSGRTAGRERNLEIRRDREYAECTYWSTEMPRTRDIKLFDSMSTAMTRERVSGIHRGPHSTCRDARKHAALRITNSRGWTSRWRRAQIVRTYVQNWRMASGRAGGECAVSGRGVGVVTRRLAAAWPASWTRDTQEGKVRPAETP